MPNPNAQKSLHPWLSRGDKCQPRRLQQAGGAVLEYVLVSAFAAAVGMAALGFVGKVVKEHLRNISDRLGIQADPEVSLPWDEPS